MVDFFYPEYDGGASPSSSSLVLLLPPLALVVDHGCDGILPLVRPRVMHEVNLPTVCLLYTSPSPRD